MASGDFRARLIELDFHFVGQLEPVFEIIVEPFSDLLDFLAR